MIECGNGEINVKTNYILKFCHDLNGTDFSRRLLLSEIVIFVYDVNYTISVSLILI